MVWLPLGVPFVLGRGQVTLPTQALLPGFCLTPSALPPTGHTVKSGPLFVHPPHKEKQFSVTVSMPTIHVPPSQFAPAMPFPPLTHSDPLLPPHLPNVFRTPLVPHSPQCAPILTVPLGTAWFQHMDSVRIGNLKTVPRTSKASISVMGYTLTRLGEHSRYRGCGKHGDHLQPPVLTAVLAALDHV